MVLFVLVIAAVVATAKYRTTFGEKRHPTFPHTRVTPGKMCNILARKQLGDDDTKHCNNLLGLGGLKTTERLPIREMKDMFCSTASRYPC